MSVRRAGTTGTNSLRPLTMLLPHSPYAFLPMRLPNEGRHTLICLRLQCSDPWGVTLAPVALAVVLAFARVSC